MGWNDNELHPHNVALGVIGGVAVAALSGLIIGWLVMVLWNWLLPDLFGIKQIGYWQGFGLVLLARLLFGNINNDNKRHSMHGVDHSGMPCRIKRKFRHAGDGETWKPLGSHHNWKYYENYWREEGKCAFENWLKKSHDGN